MKEERRLQILLVDDHALVRKEIRSMLENYADIQVVGEACNGLEAIMLTEQLRPRIVVMDINMPKMNGIEATAQIMSRYPDTIIIGLSVNVATGSQEAMARAGAVRLIPKEQGPDLLYDAIHATVQDREVPNGPSTISAQVQEE